MKLKNKGISLIENLISVFVVSLVLLALIRLYYMASYQINASRHRISAVNLAQANLEAISNVSYSGIVPADYPITQTVIIDPGSLDGSGDDLTGTMTTQLVNLNTNEGYKFIATVTWNETVGGQSRPMTEIVENLLTNYE